MVKKSEEKNETMREAPEDVKNIINQWANNSNEFLKLWGDSNLKLYKPWIEFIGEKSLKMTDISMNPAPMKYKEFYEDWLNTYRGTFGKIYPARISSPKEALESFVKCADESNKVYMSWIKEIGENSKKTSEVLNDGIDPVKYRDCFESWMKTYEKVFDEMNEHPTIKYQRDIFECYTGMPDFYSETFAKMAKQIKEIYTRLYVPSDESIKNFTEGLAKLSKDQANPQVYKEFYDMWLNNCKEVFSRMFDPQTMKPSRELLDALKESMDVNIQLFKSWAEAMEKMSSKMEDQSKLINDQEAFREFYNLWVKMYEKTSEDVLEGAPLFSPLKEMMEPVKSACKVYSNTSIKMSKMWMDSFSRMTSAPKV